MEAILFMGIQGAGKSTFYARRFCDTHIRINLDMLRTRHREALLVAACITARAKFVVDNTNATRELRRRFIEPAKAAGFRVCGVYFSSVLQECAERNALRPNPVRESALRGTLAQFEKPTRAEGFDQLEYARIVGRDFVVEEYDDEL